MKVYRYPGLPLMLRLPVFGHMFGLNIGRKRPFVRVFHWTPEELLREEAS